MSKKEIRKKFDRKTLIWTIVAAIAFILVVVMIVVMNLPEKFDSSYFHDDNNKIVLTMDKETSALDDSPWESGIVHMVYYHDGKNITNVKAFYEYPNEEMAKIAFSKLEPGEYANNKKLSGRFVIFQIDKSQYEEMTVESLKENIELLKEIDALILDYDENTLSNYPISFPSEDDEVSEPEESEVENNAEGESNENSEEESVEEPAAEEPAEEVEEDYEEEYYEEDCGADCEGE